MNTSCFHFLATMDNAVIITGMWMSIKCTDISVLADISRNRSVGLLSDFILICCGRAMLFS